MPVNKMVEFILICLCGLKENVLNHCQERFYFHFEIFCVADTYLSVGRHGNIFTISQLGAYQNNQYRTELNIKIKCIQMVQKVSVVLDLLSRYEIFSNAKMFGI